MQHASSSTEQGHATTQMLHSTLSLLSTPKQQLTSKLHDIPIKPKIKNGTRLPDDALEGLRYYTYGEIFLFYCCCWEGENYCEYYPLLLVILISGWLCFPYLKRGGGKKKLLF